MSNRRVDNEAARKERLQPVHCWEKRLITLPGTSIKAWRWIKTDRKQEFSDDEEDESNKAAVVVDEEEEVAPVSANPDGEAQENGEGEDANGSGDADAKSTKKVVKLADGTTVAEEGKKDDEEGEGEADVEDGEDDAAAPPPMPERSRSPSVPPETSTTDFLNAPSLPSGDGLTPDHDHPGGEGLYFGEDDPTLGATAADDAVFDALMTDVQAFNEADAVVAAATFDVGGDGLDSALLGTTDVDDIMNGTG
jgi:hypothetical protein